MTDPEFGEILTRINVRSQGFTFRIVDDGLLVTVPPHWTEHELLESIERMRPKLRQLTRRVEKKNADMASRHIDWNFCIRTECLSFEVKCDETLKPDQFGIQKQQGHITLLARPDTNWDADGRQEWLEKVIAEQVRGYAKGMLPPRLRALSQQFNLPIKSIQINSAHGRWGSCSHHVRSVFGVLKEDSGYAIHLSLYVLLLPERLQRLIMLHELTHTLEMNHSPRFHAKLDAMLGGTEAVLEAELKHYSTSIFSFTVRKE